MKKKSSNKKPIIVGIIIIVIAVVAAAFVLFVPRKSVAPTTPVAQQAGDQNKLAAEATSTLRMKMAPVPQGSQTYQIMQAANVVPKIVQATVNPVDVKVGDTQTLTVIVSDPNPVTSVVATIQTDHGMTTVPLALIGPATSNDVLPQKYSINTQNQLMLATSNSAVGGANIAEAAQGDEKYSATWTVKDTHVAKYSTVFTATDAQGNVNSATINWTDAECGWSVNNYSGAQWNVSTGSNFTGSAYGSSGCSFGASDPIDGPENANIVIDDPITIGSGYSFVFTPGNKITFSGSGQITIASGGQITNAQMYGSDADHDGYIAGSGWSTSSSAGSARSSFAGSTLGFNDCNDSNANVFPGQTAYFTTATTTNINPSSGYDDGGEVNFNYNCQTTLNYEYITNPTGSITLNGGCSGPYSCNTPQYTAGDFPSACGSAVQEVVNEGNVAQCLNGGVPTGQTCDVVAEGSSGQTQACN